jgi:TonB family protein
MSPVLKSHRSPHFSWAVVRRLLLALFMSIVGARLALAATDEQSVPTLELVSFASDTGGALAPNSVLAATLKYSIADFKRNSFNIFEQLAGNDFKHTYSVNKTTISPNTATGEATITFRIADALQDVRIAKPLRVKFVVSELAGTGMRRVVAETPYFQVNIADISTPTTDAAVARAPVSIALAESPNLLNIPGVKCSVLAYPENARKAEAEGVTGLSYTLSPQGKVLNVKIVKRSGMSREHRELDRAAVDFVNACTFPEQESTDPVTMEFSYRWILR